MNKVFRIDPEKPSADVINLAATVLRDGGIVVFPTETVYGIGAAAHACFGAQEIFDIKVRPLEKPLPWLVEDGDALDIYGVDVPEYAYSLAKAFWPGAVTLVVKASERVGLDFRADDGTVGLRSPDHEVIMELIRASGAPIIATSANTSGQDAPTDFAEVEERIIAAADVVLDGGETGYRKHSTVVDCTGPEPLVIRPGAIPDNDIMEAAQVGV
ncbi:MAG: L-threonylcarbamoyladenylate synthase [Coriobacteriia bacterium]|jgi:tRNA threonylcarbamoyl adenosine modification protein (Sua5/YciO/YrdC/YwlC family)|nr:L-threonylcarbamoyladenylate synthase [Coriobacteriia bacterium]